jgi:anaerobic ribonucleoside-triphosphate reductase activating protein
MTIRLANDLQFDSIVDGEGIRAVLWTQGCPHKCKGCHNPETHSFKDGKKVNIDDLKKELISVTGQDGLTLSGGEPFSQAKECYQIAKYAKEIGLNIWCYSGYTFEELLLMEKNNPYIIALLNNIDVLVDGKFILEEVDLNLKFRGSSNQRIIDVGESLRQKEICLIEKYYIRDEFTPNYIKIEGIFI